jgi:hypothetical protein
MIKRKKQRPSMPTTSEARPCPLCVNFSLIEIFTRQVKGCRPAQQGNRMELWRNRSFGPLPVWAFVTSNVERWIRSAQPMNKSAEYLIRRWAFDVRCWTFRSFGVETASTVRSASGLHHHRMHVFRFPRHGGPHIGSDGRLSRQHLFEAIQVEPA